MYNIIETDKASSYPDRKNCIISLHIIVDPLLDISKVELYRCLSDIVECSNMIQVYLYTKPDKPWIKELDKLMGSVFKSYHNINLIILRDARPIKDISNFINFTTGTILSQDLSIVATTDGILILDRLKAIRLFRGYEINNNDRLLKLKPSDYMLYGGKDSRLMMSNSINKLVSEFINKTNPKLKLKVLYVEQAEKENTDDRVDYYRNVNNTLLSKFNTILDTSIEFYSIFTDSDTVENIIKSNSKNRLRDNILIVIDSVDRSSSVNCNNNSYYIPIDTYITPKILSRIFDIILNNILK